MKFDVTLIRYRGIIVEADSEENALEKAEELKDYDEKVGCAQELKDD